MAALESTKGDGALVLPDGPPALRHPAARGHFVACIPVGVIRSRMGGLALLGGIR